MSRTQKLVKKGNGKPTFRTYNADCFEWLARQPEKSFEAVVTDPPYGLLEYEPAQIEKRSNGNGGVWRLPHAYDGAKRSPLPRFTVLKNKHHKSILEFHRHLSKLLAKVLVPGGHIFLAADPLLVHLVISGFVENGFEFRGLIIRATSTMRGGDRPKGAHKKYAFLSVIPRNCYEPWLLFRKPCEGRVKDNLRQYGVGAVRRPSKDLPFKNLHLSTKPTAEERQISAHPSLKPQQFLREIVRAALPLERGRILDPFMGSGAVLAAALAVGYSCVGVERDKEYFQSAKKSIRLLSRLNPRQSANGKVGRMGATANSSARRNRRIK